MNKFSVIYLDRVLYPSARQSKERIIEIKETIMTKKNKECFFPKIVNKEKEEYKNNNFNKFCVGQFKNSIKKFNNEIISNSSEPRSEKKEKKQKYVFMKSIFKSYFINEEQPKKYNKHHKTMSLLYLKDPQCELNLYKKIMRTTELISDPRHVAPQIHEMRYEYIINKFQKNIIEQKEKVIKIQKGLRSQEEIIEGKDSVPYYDVKEAKLKKEIYNLLSARGNKLNQIKVKPEKFYESFENQINFIQDINIVPYFKNNLINYFHETDKAGLLCKYQNFIEHGIIQYLNVLKVKTQREKDEEEEKKKNEGNEVIEKKEEKEIDVDNIEQLLLTQKLKKSEVSEEEKKKNVNLYELEDTFIHKYVRYDSINISNLHAKQVIFSGLFNK